MYFNKCPLGLVRDFLLIQDRISPREKTRITTRFQIAICSIPVHEQNKKKRTDNPQLRKLIAIGFSAPESCVNPRTAERFRETPPARRLRQHRHKQRRPTLLFSSSSSLFFSRLRRNRHRCFQLVRRPLTALVGAPRPAGLLSSQGCEKNSSPLNTRWCHCCPHGGDRVNTNTSTLIPLLLKQNDVVCLL